MRNHKNWDTQRNVAPLSWMHSGVGYIGLCAPRGCSMEQVPCGGGWSEEGGHAGLAGAGDCSGNFPFCDCCVQSFREDVIGKTLGHFRVPSVPECFVVPGVAMGVPKLL